MKRFINIATAAALTASMICVPTAIVAYAAETASFEVCMSDQVLESGKKEVTIPVSFNEDITFSSINMNMISEFISQTHCTVSIISVKSALSDAGVSVSLENNTDIKVSSSKDYTLKKGTVLFNITVQIGNLLKNPDGTEKWPMSATLRVLVKDFAMTSADNKQTVLSSESLKNAVSVTQIIPAKKTEGMSVMIGSVSSPSKTVDIPVVITGSMLSFISEFKVDNGAQITNIAASEKTNLDIKYKETSDYPRMLWVGNASENVEFKDSEVAIITLKLPDNAKENDKFNVSIRSFDPASAVTEEELYPSSITNGVITYTPSVAEGAVLSDVKVSSPYIVSRTKELDLKDLKLTATITDKNGVKSTIEINDPSDSFKVVEPETGSIERTLKLEYTGDVYTSTDPFTLTYLRGLLGDVTLDGRVDARDCTCTIKQYNSSMLGKEFLTGNIEQDESLKSIVEKYTIKTVREFSGALADVDANGRIDARDATYQVMYYSSAMLGNASWDKILNK